MALEKKGDKAGAMTALRRAYPLAPHKAEHKSNYEGLLQRE
jgi:hypothetical protein